MAQTEENIEQALIRWEQSENFCPKHRPASVPDGLATQTESTLDCRTVTD